MPEQVYPIEDDDLVDYDHDEDDVEDDDEFVVGKVVECDDNDKCESDEVEPEFVRCSECNRLILENQDSFTCSGCMKLVHLTCANEQEAELLCSTCAENKM